MEALCFGQKEIFKLHKHLELNALDDRVPV